jgi:hypothetical protein
VSGEALARLLRAPTAQCMEDVEALADDALALSDRVRQALASPRPAGVETYLRDAEKQLLLAVSSLAIAMLVEVEPPQTPGAG